MERFPASAVVYTGEVDGDLDDALSREGRRGSRDEEPTKLDEASELLDEELSERPRLAADLKSLARDEGISEATLHRARKARGVLVRREQTEKPRTWWGLPHDKKILDDLILNGSRVRPADVEQLPVDSPESPLPPGGAVTSPPDDITAVAQLHEELGVLDPEIF